MAEPDFRQIAEDHMGDGGLFVYEKAKLAAGADLFMSAALPYGHTTRYAIKANSNKKIIRLFDKRGLHFDAGSIGEVELLEQCNVSPRKISLSAQVWENETKLEGMLARGIRPIATSRRQLKRLGELGRHNVGVRINPATAGRGHNNRTTVAGPNSGFGIWHERLDEVKNIARNQSLIIDLLHIHTGSGGDPSPDIWRANIAQALSIAAQLPDVTTLDIGGGYKVARMPGETGADMQKIFQVFSEELTNFATKTGRQLRLEMEPGGFLVANAISLLGRVLEVEDTALFNFPRLNVGMNANIRFAMYGAQHPLEVLNDSTEGVEAVFLGPVCESGDNLTPKAGNPEEFEPRKVKKFKVGDYVRIGGAGAYTASMSPMQYNQIAPPTSIFV